MSIAVSIAQQAGGFECGRPTGRVALRVTVTLHEMECQSGCVYVNHEG